MAIDRCEWCGHEHARDALCTSRPKWSRRGFLSLFCTGIAGLAVAPSLSPQAKAVSAVSALSDAGVFDAAFVAGRRGGKTAAGIDAILKAYYEPIIQAQFENRNGLWQIVTGPKKGKTFRVDAR